MIMINDFGIFYLFTIFFQSTIVRAVFIALRLFALLRRIMVDQWAELVIAGL